VTRSLLVATVISAPLLIGCGGGDDRQGPVERPPQRRVIEPPTGEITTGPPYPITTDSVGPYKLRQSLASLGDRLKGASVLRFEIPGGPDDRRLLHTGLIRAEDDTLLIGSEPTTFGASTTTFLAVTGSEVARLGSVHVGSSRDEVDKLGTATEDLEHARDPRLVAPSKNQRLLIENKRVAAIVLLPETTREPAIAHEDCPRPASTATSFGACFTGAGELVEVDGDDVIVRIDDKITHKLPPLPGLVFAAPLRNEGRDELVAVTKTRSDEPAQRTWSLIVFRFEAGQFKRVPLESSLLYQVTATQMRWVGAELRDIDLYLELTNKGETIEVGGFFTRADRDRVRDVAMISPVTITRRHHKPATPEAGDAGVSGGSPGGSQGSARP
jgi:hypothetical protein